LANEYVTATELRNRLKIPDTVDDIELTLACSAASKQIEDHCGRRFWQDAEVVVRQFYADSPTVCLLDDGDEQADISTTTGLVVKIDEAGDGTFSTALTISTDFILWPLNAEDRVPARPYEEVRLVNNYHFPRPANGRPGVQITAKFGWAAVPDKVKQAALVQATLLFRSKDSVFGVIPVGEVATGRLPALHPIARALLGGLGRAAVG
jgi:hypothetical protein